MKMEGRLFWVENQDMGCGKVTELTDDGEQPQHGPEISGAICAYQAQADPVGHEFLHKRAQSERSFIFKMSRFFQ
jgi:aminoglycoside phosphotransferase